MIKNSFFFIGKIVRDPEQKVFQSGNTLTTVCIAVTSKNKHGEYTDFFDISMWGPLGETAKKYLKKGRLVAVEGEIRTRTIDTQNGKRKVYDFKATDFRFLDAPPAGNTNNATQTNPAEEEDVLENFEEVEEAEQQKVVPVQKKKNTTSSTKKSKTAPQPTAEPEPDIEEFNEVEDDLPF